MSYILAFPLNKWSTQVNTQYNAKLGTKYKVQ